MAKAINNQPFTIQAGASEIGPVNLPQGSKFLLVTYACGTWPVVSDGTLVITLKISDDNGQNYRDEWTDTIEHVQLSRGGVVQNTAQFGIQLSQPFGPASKLRVAFQSTVTIPTTVSLDIT